MVVQHVRSIPSQADRFQSTYSNRQSRSRSADERRAEMPDGKNRRMKNPDEGLAGQDRKSQQANPYFHAYNDEYGTEEKSSLPDSYRDSSGPSQSSRRDPADDFYDNQGESATDSRKDGASRDKKSKKTKKPKKNQPYFYDYDDQQAPQEEAKQNERSKSGYTAGMSTAAKVNHPYNFSYGDQEMPEDKPRNIDTGFIAGMSTAAKVNHPYNFSYGDQEMPEDKPRNIDTGFIAGMSTGGRVDQPYNFAYGKSNTWLIAFFSGHRSLNNNLQMT